MVLIAPIGLIYVPSRVMVAGDAGATIANLRSAEGLMRLGIASELVHQAIFVFVVLALYRLFEPVDRWLALSMLVLGALLSVPIAFLNVINEVAALMLVSGADFLAPFERAELDSLAYLFLRLHARGINLASIFWGLWLFPFGLLVLRSSFVPRVFGYLLMVAGTGILAGSFTALVLPEYAPMVSRLALPLQLAELPIVFWLAIRGARGVDADQPVDASPLRRGS